MRGWQQHGKHYLLSALEYLDFSFEVYNGEMHVHAAERLVSFPTAVLAPLQQLTCLVLSNEGSFQGPDETAPALQPLQGLSRLAALELSYWELYSVTASMLLCQLTRLE